MKTKAPILAAVDWLAQEDESGRATRDNGAALNLSSDLDDLATSSIDKGAIAPRPLPLAPSASTPLDANAPLAIAPGQKLEPRAAEKSQRTAHAPRPRQVRSPAAPVKKTAARRPARVSGMETRTKEREARAFAQSVMKMQPTGSGFFVSGQFYPGSFAIRGF